MASQPSKSLRNDLGRATLTVLPVGYSQNGYSKKKNFTSLHRKITRVSNFPRILRNYTHEQTVVTRRSFPLPLNAWVQVYQLSIMSTCQTPISFHTTYYKPDMGKPKQPFLQYSGYFNTWTMDHGLDCGLDYGPNCWAPPSMHFTILVFAMCTYGFV